MGQIREPITHSWIVDRARGSEGTLTSFSDYKEDSGRFILSDLQDSINVELVEKVELTYLALFTDWSTW